MYIGGFHARSVETLCETAGLNDEGIEEMGVIAVGRHREIRDFLIYPHKRLKLAIKVQNRCKGRGPLIKAY